MSKRNLTNITGMYAETYNGNPHRIDNHLMQKIADDAEFTFKESAPLFVKEGEPMPPAEDLPELNYNLGANHAFSDVLGMLHSTPEMWADHPVNEKKAKHYLNSWPVYVTVGAGLVYFFREPLQEKVLPKAKALKDRLLRKAKHAVQS